ncbi:hypothetical protein GQ53DRAFT_765960 [Thozetella sp. PMI_491]|nr:hypothetical protein GQ53DRAFT_765960 [Thozetella sp. PMI_491]
MAPLPFVVAVALVLALALGPTNTTKAYIAYAMEDSGGVADNNLAHQEGFLFIFQLLDAKLRAFYTHPYSAYAVSLRANKGSSSLRSGDSTEVPRLLRQHKPIINGYNIVQILERELKCEMCIGS